MTILEEHDTTPPEIPIVRLVEHSRNWTTIELEDCEFFSDSWIAAEFKIESEGDFHVFRAVGSRVEPLDAPIMRFDGRLYSGGFCGANHGGPYLENVNLEFGAFDLAGNFSGWSAPVRLERLEERTEEDEEEFEPCEDYSEPWEIDAGPSNTSTERDPEAATRDASALTGYATPETEPADDLGEPQPGLPDAGGQRRLAEPVSKSLTPSNSSSTCSFTPSSISNFWLALPWLLVPWGLALRRVRRTPSE